MTKTVGERRNGASPERIGVLVLGMHRSGTSALTRVLNLLGCDLPKALMEGNSFNQAGHWESLSISKLDEEILSSAGSKWWDWLAFNPGWHSSPKAGEFREKAIALLQEEYGRSRLFVLKDPRICRFAPFWLDVLKAAGVTPAIVMPVRNPLEVAASISERDGIDSSLGHLIWLRHVLEAEAGTRGVPRFHSSYDALLSGWPRLAAGAQEALGISWPRLSPLVGEEIDAFLTERLRHHRESPKSIADNPLLSGWLRDAFSIFSRWAEEGEDTADHAALDRIRAELDGAAPAFSRLISAGQQSARKAQALDASLREAQEKLTQAEAATASQQEQVTTLERQLEETRSELTTSQATAEQRQRQIAEFADRIGEAQTQLTALQAEAEDLRSEVKAARGELSHAQSELAQRRAEADDAAAQLQQAEQRHSAELEAQRSSANAEIEKLRRERRKVEERLDERFNEIATLTRMLGDRESAARALEEQTAWLREVSAVLLNGSSSHSLKSRLAALLPAPIRLKKQKARLQRSGTFDPDAYLAANPDVAEAGIDPLWHYINHGMLEGRELQPSITKMDFTNER